MSKHAKKPVLKRSLLSYAVAVAVGGFGQGALAVDLCTAPANTVSALSPADYCLLDTAAETLAVTAAGSVGSSSVNPGVDVSVVGAGISNAGLIAGNYTAIHYNNLGLGGSLANTGTVEVDNGHSWAAGVYITDGSLSGTLNNNADALINAVADSGNSDWAGAVYIGGVTTSSSSVTVPPLPVPVGTTVYTSDSSYIGEAATGTLINAGTMSASALATTWYGSAYATGVFIGGAVQGSINNSGTISAEARQSFWANAYATGVALDGGAIDSKDRTTFSISGSTHTNYSDAQAFIGLGSTAALTNSGTVSAAATGDYYNATATGLYIDGVVQGDISNTGTISASAQTYYYDNVAAIAVEFSQGDVNSQSGTKSYTAPTGATNAAQNDVSVWASLGIDTTGSFANSATGTLNAAASVGSDSASATGLYVDGAVLGSISNAGVISAAAHADDYNSNAYAVVIESGWIGTDTTSSTANTTDTATVDTAASTNDYQVSQSDIGLGLAASLTNATGGSIIAAAEANRWATATGVYVDGVVLGTVSNSGTIIASAESHVWDDDYAFATGLRLGDGQVISGAYGGSSNSTTTTTPAVSSLTTAATGYSNYATSYGGLGVAAALTNSGTITASADAGDYGANATAVDINGAVLGSVTNSGSITAAAEAYRSADAMALLLGGGYVGSSTSTSSSGGMDSTTIVSASVTQVDATNTGVNAYGGESSYIGLDTTASLTNSGSITAIADAGDYSASATGLQVYGATLGDISNSGSIAASSETSYGGRAYAHAVDLNGGTISSYSGDNSGSDAASTTTTTIPASTTVTGTSSYESASASAYGSSYVGLGADASFTNAAAGSITATAAVHADWNNTAVATAFSLDGVVLGSISNSGSIAATASVEYLDAYARGIELFAGDIITNSGTSSASGSGTSDSFSSATLDTTASTSTGVSAYTYTSGAGSSDVSSNIGIGAAGALSNSGTISATADAGRYGDYGRAYATAIYIDGAVLGAISNSGSVTATATAEYSRADAYGLIVDSGQVDNINSGSGNGTSSTSNSTSSTVALDTTASTWNYETVTTWATASSDIALGAAAALTNSGTISATATAGQIGDTNGYNASASAVDLRGAVLGAVTNSGTVSASATAGYQYAYAYGLQLGGGDISSGNGSGNGTDGGSYGGHSTSSDTSLLHTDASVTHSGSTSAYVSDDAYVGLGESATLTNSGTISASAVVGSYTASASALYISGAVLGAINNSGSITATAAAGYEYAYAYGLDIGGGWVRHHTGSSSDSSDGTQDTTGFITESSTSTAYSFSWDDNQAYVGLGAGATLTNSGTISASATAGDLADNNGYTATATAADVNGAILGAISNTGTISATATTGYRYADANGLNVGGGEINHYTRDGSGNSSDSSSTVSTSSSTSSWMSDEQYVSLGTTGTLINSGTVSASATANRDAYARGLDTNGALLGSLTNAAGGTISALAVVGDRDAYALGARFGSGGISMETGSSENGNSVYVYSYADTAVGSAGSIVNNGTISAIAQAGSDSASATGMIVDGVIQGAVTNTGLIEARATSAGYDAYAWGIELYSGEVSSGNQDSGVSDYVSLGQTGVFTNAGTVNAFAEAIYNYASATAMYVSGTVAGSIVNSGTLRAAADAGNYDAEAYGLTISGDVSGTVTNTNAIAASANVAGDNAYARAVTVWGNVSGSIVNSDSLGAYAGATTGGAYATGLLASDDVSGSISNSGTIDVAADGGTGYASATGVRLGSMSGTGSLANTGYIGVKSESSTYGADAYGVVVDGEMHGSSMITNAAGAEINLLVNADNSVSAYGVDLGMLFDTAQFSNAGSVSVQVNGGTGDDTVVYGVHTHGLYDAAQLVNSGTIAVEQAAWGTALVVGLSAGTIHDNAGLSNSGTVSVSSSAGQYGEVTAKGLEIGSAYAGATMINSGTITVTGSGGSFIGGLSSDPTAADVNAIGISLDSQMVDSTLSNTSTGVINVTATSDTSSGTGGILGALIGEVDLGGNATVYGIKGGLVDGASTVSNDGSIVATATGANSTGYGIYVRALTHGAQVVNTGTIEVEAANAYGIFVAGGIDGAVVNSGTIGNGVSLGGNVSLTNSGSITNTHSTVGGNYTQAAGGSLGFTAVDATHYGTLAVGGTADFTADNSVVVLVDANDNLESGDVLADVVSAGTLTASAFDVTDNTLFWTFDPTIDGNTLDLTANYLGAARVLEGSNLNVSASFAGMIDGIIADGADGQYADLAAALNAAPDAAAAAALLEGFLPTLNGNIGTATLVGNAGVSDVIDARIDQTSGAASGDAFKDGGVWLKTFLGNGKQDRSGTIRGYDLDSSGLVIGVDGAVSDAWRVGLAVGQTRSDVTDQATKVDVQSTLVSLYGSYTMNERTALDLTLGFGNHNYNSNRGTFGVASFDGDQFSLGAKASRNYKVNEKTAFIPSVAVDFVKINVGGYTEAGGTGFGSNQTVAAADFTSTSIAANGKYEWTMSNTGVITANLGLGIDNADNVRVTSTLNGGTAPLTYTTNGITPENVFLNAGVGYRYVTKKDLEIVVGYDLEARQDFQAGAASLKFKMPF